MVMPHVIIETQDRLVDSYIRTKYNVLLEFVLVLVALFNT
jgi:hypothetical protein